MSEYTDSEMKAMLQSWRPPDAPTEVGSSLAAALMPFETLEDVTNQHLDDIKKDPSGFLTRIRTNSTLHTVVRRE